MVTAEEQPPFVYRDDFERRSAEFDRRFDGVDQNLHRIDDDLRELRQGQKDLADEINGVKQEITGIKQQLAVLEQGQKAIHQRFDDFKENVDRRITTLTWIVTLGGGGLFAMLGWLIARGG